MRLASLRQLRALSLSLCASGKRYEALAAGAGVAAACVLPPPLGGALLDWQAQRLGGGDAFTAVQTALLLTACLYCVLAVLARWEWRQRQLFVRQRRLAAEAPQARGRVGAHAAAVLHSALDCHSCCMRGRAVMSEHDVSM